MLSSPAKVASFAVLFSVARCLHFLGSIEEQSGLNNTLDRKMSVMRRVAILHGRVKRAENGKPILN
jgi:hypothetical protein